MRHRIVVLWLVSVGLGGCSGVPEGVGNERPNILVLIADDQRWDQMSCAEQPLIPELQTPNLDRLAGQGVLFRNAFVTTPICAVSRACIMTGRYASTHGMNHFNTPLAPEVLSQSYPALLRDNGYRTGVLGKWGMGIEGTEEVFDVFDAWADQGGYFHETDDGKVHNAEWLANRAREFLQSCGPEAPFCLTVCFKSPHHPYHPDPRDEGLFEDVVIPARKSDTPEAYQALPSHMMEESLNRWCYFDERKDEATKEKFEKDFLRCVVSLDRAVGEIMAALRDLDVEDNTIVVYLSDNGYLWGEHGLGGKWLLYEESIRVPIAFYGPCVPVSGRGARPAALALNIDVAPTILDLAGVPVPAGMNGASLRPILEGHEVPWREDFFLEHVGVIDVQPPIPDSRGVRDEEWKYIRYLTADSEVEELYLLEADPLEMNNVVNDEDHAGIRERLRDRYDEYLELLAR